MNKKEKYIIYVYPKSATKFKTKAERNESIEEEVRV